MISFERLTCILENNGLLFLMREAVKDVSRL